MKKIALKAIYTGVAAMAIYYIVTRVDFSTMWMILKRVHPSMLTLLLAFSMFQIFLAAAVWSMVLKKQRVDIPLRRLTSWYFVGSFISMVLPTKYSGDVYRTYCASRYSGSASLSAASVLLERLTGIVLIMAMAVVASFFGQRIFEDPRLTLVISLSLASVLGGIWLAFTDHAFSIAEAILTRIHLSRILAPLRRFRTAVLQYGDHRRFLVKVIAVSGVFKILAFVWIYVAGISIGIRIPVLSLIIIMPVIYILEALPISIHGLGVREGAFLFFFTKAGLLPEQAFALSIVVLFSRTACNLVGGILLMFQDSTARHVAFKPTACAVGEAR